MDALITQASTQLTALQAKIERVDNQISEAKSKGDDKEVDALRVVFNKLLDKELILLRQQGQQPGDILQDFKGKLAKFHVTKPSEKAMTRLMLYFPEQMRIAAQPTADASTAYHLYEQAKRLPGTETRLALTKQQRISVNGPWLPDHPSLVTAVDLKSGSLLVLKILSIASAELRTAATAQKLALEQLQLDKLCHDSVLVPAELVQVQVPPEHVQAVQMATQIYSALKMPMFMSSLDKLPQLEEEFIYQGGLRLQSALKLMHEQQLLHADLKASNVFLNSAAAWTLGDFGSVVTFGDKITSCTENWYPGDIRFKEADPKYDWGLLVVLLAVEIDKAAWQYLVGESSPQKVQMDCVLHRCECTKHAGLQSLLKELLELADWSG